MELTTLWIWISLWAIICICAYFTERNVLKLGAGVFGVILGAMLLGGVNIPLENCENLPNYVNQVHIYGKNLTGYHWDYDVEDAPNNPDIMLFHIKDYYNYSLVCSGEEVSTPYSEESFTWLSIIIFLLSFMILFEGYEYLLKN